MTSNLERTAARGRKSSASGLLNVRSLSALLLVFGLAMGCGPGEEVEEPSDAQTASDASGVDGAVVDGETADGAGDATTSDSKTSGDAGSASGALTARSLRFSEDMKGIWGSGADDIWWVGAEGRILHYNGHALAPRKSGTTKDLYSVWGRGPKDVWIVGDGIVLHYNGIKLLDRTPDGMSKTVFRSVHAPTDNSTVLIAGDDGIIFRVVKQTKLMKETTNSSLKIRSIRAVDAGTAWAVGDKGQALRLSGGSWSSVPLPKANADLHGLDVSAGGRVFTVGDGGYVAATESKLWKDGLTNDPKSRDLYGIWTMGDKEAWAVGKSGALVHHIGTKWNITDIDGTYMKTGTFRAVWGMPKSGDTAAYAFAVGDNGVGLRFDGDSQKWLDYRAETKAHLNQVTTLPDGRLVVAGNAGLLLEATTATADMVDLGAAVTGTHLRGVAPDGAKGFWAVGDGGVTVHVTDTGAQTVVVAEGAAGQRLSGVALAGKDVVAVGHGGIALRWDDGQWKEETTGVQFNLTAIAAHGDTAWAVGEFGTVVRRDKGGKWSKEATAESFNLHRVVAWDKGAVAVGDNGLVLARKDGKWTKVFESPGLFLYGVARRDNGTIIGVGWKGTLVVGADDDWKVVDSGLPNVLLDVATSGKDAVAIGHNGGVYQIDASL
ncbi:MAG: hypothetical protein KC502_00470 [Myxococcales bacterium]|nr:hypothetical protein [Myxococcales bacterium]